MSTCGRWPKWHKASLAQDSGFFGKEMSACSPSSCMLSSALQWVQQAMHACAALMHTSGRGRVTESLHAVCWCVASDIQLITRDPPGCCSLRRKITPARSAPFCTKTPCRVSDCSLIQLVGSGPEESHKHRYKNTFRRIKDKHHCQGHVE